MGYLALEEWSFKQRLLHIARSEVSYTPNRSSVGFAVHRGASDLVLRSNQAVSSLLRIQVKQM